MEGILKNLRRCDKAAVKHKQRELSYAKLIRVVDGVAAMVRGYGIREENVGILGDNSLQFVTALLGVSVAANTCVLLNRRSVFRELAKEVQYCDVNWIVCEPCDLGLATAIRKIHGTGICVIDNGLQVSCYATPFCRFQRCNSSDIAFLLHTSGSTNSPKRVMLTHNNILANVDSSANLLPYGSDERFLLSLPIHFVTALTCQFLLTLAIGGTLILYDELVFNVRRFHEILDVEQITLYATVPSIFYILSKHRLRQSASKHLKYLCVSGGPVSASLLEEIERRYPSAQVVQMYGLTECSPRVSALLPAYAGCKRGSVGKPVRNVQVEIVDAHDQRVRVRETGEIRVKGTNVMAGYYKNPEETNRCLREGWCYTGDLGFHDDEGFIYLNGRRKNVIITGGVNIYPEEVEEVLRELSGIEEALVMGKEDEAWGEIPIAYLVANNNPLEAAEIQAWLKLRLSVDKHPREYHWIADIPKTDRGKIHRSALRSQFDGSDV